MVYVQVGIAATARGCIGSNGNGERGAACGGTALCETLGIEPVASWAGGISSYAAAAAEGGTAPAVKVDACIGSMSSSRNAV